MADSPSFSSASFALALVVLLLLLLPFVAAAVAVAVQPPCSNDSDRPDYDDRLDHRRRDAPAAAILTSSSVLVLLAVLLLAILVLLLLLLLLLVFRKKLLERRTSSKVRPREMLLAPSDFVFPPRPTTPRRVGDTAGRVDEGIETVLGCWLQRLREFGGPDVEKPDLLRPGTAAAAASSSSSSSSSSKPYLRGSTGNLARRDDDFFQDPRARYNGDLVQLKRLPTSNRGAFELRTEAMDVLATIHGLRHENLNPLVGCLNEPTRPCLVYEYCSRGSLEDVLMRDEIELDWSFRLSLLTDLVRVISTFFFFPLSTVSRRVTDATILPSLSLSLSLDLLLLSKGYEIPPRHADTGARFSDFAKLRCRRSLGSQGHRLRTTRFLRGSKYRSADENGSRSFVDGSGAVETSEPTKERNASRRCLQFRHRDARGGGSRRTVLHARLVAGGYPRESDETAAVDSTVREQRRRTAGSDKYHEAMLGRGSRHETRLRRCSRSLQEAQSRKKGQFRRYDVSNAGEVFEQSGRLDSRAYGAIGRGEEENGAIVEPNVTELRR